MNPTKFYVIYDTIKNMPIFFHFFIMLLYTVSVTIIKLWQYFLYLNFNYAIALLMCLVELSCDFTLSNKCFKSVHLIIGTQSFVLNKWTIKTIQCFRFSYGVILFPSCWIFLDRKFRELYLPIYIQIVTMRMEFEWNWRVQEKKTCHKFWIFWF